MVGARDFPVGRGDSLCLGVALASTLQRVRACRALCSSGRVLATGIRREAETNPPGAAPPTPSLCSHAPSKWRC